jgi:streptomycin 6-kinase
MAPLAMMNGMLYNGQTTPYDRRIWIMGKRDMTLPAPVRQKLALLGAAGSKWLADLDDLIEDLEQEWQITVGAVREGGTEAYVAQARTSDGTPVILKVAIPASEGNTVLAQEVTALTLADGHGYARLLHSDLTRRALLLEALGLPLKALGYSSKAQIDIICMTLKASWVQGSPEAPLATGITMAKSLSNFISILWEQLDRPCSTQVFETALSYAQARARAFTPENAVLVHGDAHNGNTLQSLSQTAKSPSSFKFIDPDGIIAEGAYDLGVLMREWMDELMADPVSRGRERCAYLSQLTGMEPQAIWQWGFIQSVSTGLFLLQMGMEQAGKQMLTVAEAWATA